VNKYLKSFIFRGAVFGGLGPMILGIVYAVLEASIDGFSLGGAEVLIAIVSTYLIAFVQAGASVFNQIEEWQPMKSVLFHFLSIYAVYALAYVMNSWIPFDPRVLLIFTGIFVLVYAVIWLTVYFSIKLVSRRMSARL